jgi:putative phosphoribosyl transferase
VPTTVPIPSAAQPIATVAPVSSARGVLVFGYGPDECRPSPRDQPTARYLARSGYVSLMIDLLATEPGPVPHADVADLSRQLTAVVDRAAAHYRLPVGLLAAGVTAGAALVTAADRPDLVRAVVSRGGRPHLAGATLADVSAPTLLILGGQDGPLIPGNKRALAVLGRPSRLVVLPEVRHLLTEPTALAEVARQARDWYDRHLSVPARNG